MSENVSPVLERYQREPDPYVFSVADVAEAFREAGCTVQFSPSPSIYHPGRYFEAPLTILYVGLGVHRASFRLSSEGKLEKPQGVAAFNLLNAAIRASTNTQTRPCPARG